MLTCPVCRAPLKEQADGFACKNRHSFDRHRSGYVNLLIQGRLPSRASGDSREMEQARRRFLGLGYYQPFRDELVRLAGSLCEGIPSPRIADAGCGEGYYTSAIHQGLAGLGHMPQTVGFDLSKPALTLAARRDPGIQYAVASLFHLPLADRGCDLLFNLFAPYSAGEFRRVVTPGGALVMAVAGERHLFGLKQVLYDRPYENQVEEYRIPGFRMEDRQRVAYRAAVRGQEAIGDLFLMTPYYWRSPAAGKARLETLSELETELDFVIFTYRRR